jgi:wyosine [tRNA(Phe)-imidazoG37] synthetase (radical SAM superfamily)
VKFVSSHIFGPVPSRRLGRSLGVDLVPFKFCSYDCIYCQLGCTTNKTIQRDEWTPLEEVLDELKGKLDTNPDYITLSGSGEPTLYSRTGELIAKIKDMTDIPVAVLTNGSLLWLPSVRNELMQADLVIPSLDSGSDRVFQEINRPCPEVTFDKMLDGLIQFRREYTGQYWLELFVINGLNTTKEEIKALSDCIKKISPDKVQVNTVTRPPAEKFALPVSKDRLEEIAVQLAENAEVIADYQQVHAQESFTARRDDVLELVRRRPCSIEDIAEGLGLHRNEVVKYVEDLTSDENIGVKLQGNRRYYKAT